MNVLVALDALVGLTVVVVLDVIVPIGSILRQMGTFFLTL